MKITSRRGVCDICGTAVVAFCDPVEGVQYDGHHYALVPSPLRRKYKHSKGLVLAAVRCVAHKIDGQGDTRKFDENGDVVVQVPDGCCEESRETVRWVKQSDLVKESAKAGE